MTLNELQKLFPDASEDTWHQHPNGGGWVQNTAHVYEDARVSGDALVYGQAQVSEQAWVYDQPRCLAPEETKPCST